MKVKRKANAYYCLRCVVFQLKSESSPRSVVVNLQYCDTLGLMFELQSHYDVHFWTTTFGKGMKTLISPDMGLIGALLYFYMVLQYTCDPCDC